MTDTTLVRVSNPSEQRRTDTIVEVNAPRLAELTRTDTTLDVTHKLIRLGEGLIRVVCCWCSSRGRHKGHKQDYVGLMCVGGKAASGTRRSPSRIERTTIRVESHVLPKSFQGPTLFFQGQVLLTKSSKLKVKGDQLRWHQEPSAHH